MEKKIVDVTPVEEIDFSCYSKFLNSIMFKLGVPKTLEQCIHGYSIHIDIDNLDSIAINNLVLELARSSLKTFTVGCVFDGEDVPNGIDKKSVEFLVEINGAKFLVSFLHDICDPSHPYSDLYITQVRQVLERSPFNTKLPLYQGIYLLTLFIEIDFKVREHEPKPFGIEIESYAKEEGCDGELDQFFFVPLMKPDITPYFISNVVEQLAKENFKLNRMV